MKRILLALLALPLLSGIASALDAASIPPKFPLVWGQTATAPNYIRSIPTTSQIGIQNCAASLTDGFPPLTFTPGSAGGCPPFGQDFNGILKQITQWSQWVQAGGPVFYDSAFSTSVNGYPNGAILTSTIVPGYKWMSTADNNTGDPDAGAPNWIQLPGQILTGTPTPSLSTTIPTGYVSANGRTIGNASSNGTNRASADTQFLFAFVWTNCPNTICPIFTSGGIASTRGGTAAIDFAANKALAVQNMNGSALMGADSQNGTTSTNLSSVPVVVGVRTSPNSILGENLHQLLLAEIPTGLTSSNPSQAIAVGTGNLFFPAIGQTGQANWAGTTFTTPGGGQIVPYTGGLTNTIVNLNSMSGNNSIAVTSNNTGNGSHNTVPRSTITYWNLKL